jgi:hypothetical protein
MASTSPYQPPAEPFPLSASPAEPESYPPAAMFSVAEPHPASISYPGGAYPAEAELAVPIDRSRTDRLWRRLTQLIAAVVLVVVSVAVTTFVTDGSGTKRDDAVWIKPGAPSPTVDTGDRSKDPAPLTTKEVFPTKALQFGRVRYEVIATQEEKRCPETASGNASTMLRSLDCTQVIRAAITDTAHTFLITAGILNLATADNVNALADALRGTGGGNFDMIVPTNMTVDAAQARPLHFSRNGHYLIFTTGVPIKTVAGQNIFNDPALAQALNITRVITADAIQRRELGAQAGA